MNFVDMSFGSELCPAMTNTQLIDTQVPGPIIVTPRKKKNSQKQLLVNVDKQVLELRKKSSVSSVDTLSSDFDGSSPSPQSLTSIEKQHLQFIERGNRQSNKSTKGRSSVDVSQFGTFFSSDTRKNNNYLLRNQDATNLSNSHGSTSSGCSSHDERVLEEAIDDPATEVDLAIFSPLLGQKTSFRRTPAPPTNVQHANSYAQQIAKQVVAQGYSNLSSNLVGYSNQNPIAGLFSKPHCVYCYNMYLQRSCLMPNNGAPSGPWSWHSTYDSRGNVTCPLLWFRQREIISSSSTRINSNNTSSLGSIF